ncbi:hypothetical protein Tco_0861400 [Tanacetum coccineum]|uniref:Uncharacterized protein n=1 Tax=Tanacetum coccineum TaxID=301880 RepID=A0ABQ5BLC1_9ASTR
MLFCGGIKPRDIGYTEHVDLNNNHQHTNEAVNTAHGVSTASTQVNAANFYNIDNMSDASYFCTSLAIQPNSPQLVHEDLQQIYPDDMEEMDLRWQMHLLMRAKELQEIKTTRIRKAQEGVCLWKHLLPQLGVM